MNIRCLIVDDEPLAVRLISSYIRDVPGFEVVAICNSAIEAFTVLRRQKIDLMFLDIKMPTLTGIDFLRSLSEPPRVILVTAYREYALDGFDLDVVDYLLKPVSLPRFLKAVAKATNLISRENQVQLTGSASVEKDNAFLYLKVDREMTKVLIKEILFIESCKEYVKIYLEGHQPIIVKQSISSMEKLLSPHRFIRVHRSYIATIGKIDSFTSAQITVRDHKLPIGRLYKNEVEKALKFT